MQEKTKRYLVFGLLALIVLTVTVYATTTTLTDSGLSTTSITAANSSFNNITSTGNVAITNTDAGHALLIDQNGASPTSTSVGGALLMEMTGNTGAGLVIYSNAAGTATGRLMNIRADNTAFPQPALHIDYDGVANAMEIVHNNNDSSSEALDITSYNEQDTTLGISGMQTARGVFKVTHDKPSSDDSSASAISIVVNGVGSKAMGVYIDGTQSNTTGSLLVAKNWGQQLVKIDYNGTLILTGNVTEIPACSAANEGAIYYNKALKGHYGCNVTNWYRLY